ncbi:hypothetical protein A3A69_00030 [candidate division WWE3 bacterium RIFCSPLOWO2_01_FULL_37_15]|uniref:Glycosyl transferase family 1 domain-containing protein n=1 Tax=candidate division WWE3 bacterium RIFCSPLOWO2_01_FULL_37_15 TaxID=1802622 RepID=A0A1F4V1H9_UNCKA|nr:MAG: hypothetical protein A3A69_00030 [candidate division WWE3 bacterium RIFCSPLOWO2_01_FULL_37_15]
MILGFGGRLDKNNWLNKSYEVFQKYHEKDKYDLVLGQSSAALGIIFKKDDLDIKVVSIAHGSIIGELKTYYKEVYNISDYLKAVSNTAFAIKNFFTRQREYVLGSDKIIAVSNAVKNALIDETFSPDEKIVVIHNGINPPEIEYKNTSNMRESISLIYVGKMIKSKGVFNLIDIVSDQRFANVKLIMVGDGRDFKHLKSYSDSKKLTEKIEFYGNIPPEKVIPLMQSSDIFVMPTLRFEGFPMTLVEAMFAGLPVVANNMGGISDAVINGETGFLADPANLNDFKEKLLKLVSNKELIREMGLKAQGRAKNEFTTEVMVNKYELVFDEVLKK